MNLAAMPEQQPSPPRCNRCRSCRNDPRLQQVIRIDNDITPDMDIDITIEEGIDVPSIQAEQFQVLIQLAGTQPGLIPPEILIASSNLRNKDELLEMLKEHQQAAAQQQQAQQKMVADKAQGGHHGAAGQGGGGTSRWAGRAAAARSFITSPTVPATGWRTTGTRRRTRRAIPEPWFRRRFRRRWTARTLQGLHAKAAVDEARAGDLRQSAVQRSVGDMLIARHNALAPPEQPGEP